MSTNSPKRVAITVNIPEKRILDLLCSGLDPGYGGALYWIDTYEGLAPPSGEQSPKYMHEHAWQHGIEISYDPSGGGDAEPELERVILNREAIHLGLVIMAEKYSSRFGDFMRGNDDAITGDVLVQLSVFGELVFG